MKAPTALELFGPHPWVADPAPGGTGPSGPYLYNPNYFATLVTARLVAAISEAGLGLPPGSCTVVAADDITPSGPYQQNQPNQMIQLPDKSLHNAGRIALEFQTWGGADISLVNTDLTGEFGLPFTYAASPAPAGLMVAKIGGVATQQDGTTWQRLT